MEIHLWGRGGRGWGAKSEQFPIGKWIGGDFPQWYPDQRSKKEVTFARNPQW